MIRYRRSGDEGRRWGVETIGPTLIQNADDGKVTIRLTIPAGGRGKTALEIGIEASEFGDLAKLMIAADPVAAIRAFGKAMEDASIRRR